MFEILFSKNLTRQKKKKNFVISSQAGVQQGDPLDSFLFCLVLQVLVSKLSKEAPNLALNNWYMDDGSLFGKIVDILKAWNIIKEFGPALGLFVNLEKCELEWWNRCS